jgi:hypothetical protein
MLLNMPRLFPKKNLPPALHATLGLHVSHAIGAPAHSPPHASAPMHAVARLVPVHAHAGVDRYARRDRICMRPLPMPANVAT